MIQDIKNHIRFNLKNIPGWRTSRKLLIFESDDWGSVRMPSLNAYDIIVKSGVPIENSYYDRNDTLARAEDLESLFNVLMSVKDSTGRPAVFNPFVNPCNPHYQKIKESGFELYYPEVFFDTLDRWGETAEIKSLWMQGIQDEIFNPAYHGREHLCVPLWMRHLKNGNKLLREGFNNEFYSVPLSTLNSNVSAFRPALYFDRVSDIPQLSLSIKEGLAYMKELFPKFSYVFCPPNGVSHQIFDDVAFENDINTIVALRKRPEPDGRGGFSHTYYRFGKQRKNGQVYYSRNCGFEPGRGKMNAAFCLQQIDAAFRWGKPAVISTHRVNYMGKLNPKNRKIGLEQLKELLERVTKKHPSVEFITSQELSELIIK